jgi:hypothetical protein
VTPSTPDPPPPAGTTTRAGAPAPPLRRALAGPLVLVGLATVVGLTGHRRRAAIVLLIAVVLTVALVSSPRHRTIVVPSASVVGAVVGRVLGYVVLVPAYYIFVAPFGLLMRAFGARPLDVSLDRTRESYWTARVDGNDRRPRRMYTDQRGWHPIGFSPRQRRRVVMSTAFTMLVLQGAIVGGAYVVNQRRTNLSPAPPSGVASISAPKSAAMRNLDWAPAAFKDTGAVVRGLVYSPFVGSSLRDYQGQYVNVKDRVRKSYETPLVQTKKPIDVWFFGGSTMFGFDLQRDLHTIPSEVVRLAEADGIAIRAFNYGAPGLVNYQETVLLSMLTTGGKKPDVAVFYDGINDSALGLVDTIGGMSPPGEPAELGAMQQRRALAASGEIPGATADPPAPLGLHPETKPVSAQQVVDDTVNVYRQGVDLGITLAGRYGFEILHFWQPDIYSKAPLDPGELELFPTLSLTPERHEMLRNLGFRVRGALPPDTIDISDALNGVDGPVLTDIVHLNEVGGRAVAEKMYAKLRPTLLRLSGNG